MKSSRLVLIAATVIATLLTTYVLGQLGGGTATAATDGPTKEEFEKLRADVTKIHKLEEENLGLINEVDKRDSAETKRLDTQLTSSEFKFAGIGDIVASALTLDQFRKVRGDNDPKKPQWVLCNGSDREGNYLYSTSQYAKDSGRSNVPNLAGKYPRGMRDGFTLLQELPDQLENHTHAVRRNGGVRLSVLSPVKSPDGNNEVAWIYQEYPGDPKIIAAEIQEGAVAGENLERFLGIIPGIPAK